MATLVADADLGELGAESSGDPARLERAAGDGRSSPTPTAQGAEEILAAVGRCAVAT